MEKIKTKGVCVSCVCLRVDKRKQGLITYLSVIEKMIYLHFYHRTL